MKVYSVDWVNYVSDGYDGEKEEYETKGIYSTREAAEAALHIPDEEIELTETTWNDWFVHYIDTDGLRTWKEKRGWRAWHQGVGGVGDTPEEAKQELQEDWTWRHEIREWEVE